jgi:choice-of-anchor B domain-containing protein
MNYRFLALLVFLGFSSLSEAQINLNQIGRLTYSRDLSDVWGYTDSSGHEYALVGVYNGFSIVDIDTPSNPQQIHFVGGSNTSWRDVKVWGHYAYVVSEGNDQLLIVDLSQLPNSITTYTRSPLGMSSCHNIFIDEFGKGYLVGTDISVGGAIIIDIAANPTNPPVLGHYNQYYIHDVFVRGDTMWAAMVNNGFIGVIDVSNLSNVNSPQAILGIQTTPNNFAHNVWVSDDNNYMFTTDERPGSYITAYNVERMNNIFETDRIQSSPGQNVIPHNTFFKDGFLITSYYRDGIVIHDAKVPQKLVETGNFDTSPNFSGNGFNGAWGVYPYLPSGLILAADIEEGLFILGPTYQEAARVTGIVRDSLCGSRLSNVEVQILNGSGSGSSDVTGQYWLGQLDTGIYDIQFSRNGYQTRTIQNVLLSSGVIDTIDVRLVPLNTVNVDILVLDSSTGNPIPNASILFSQGGTATLLANTNAQGRMRDCTFPADVYDMHWGKWGYQTELTSNLSIPGPNFKDTIFLSFGYYDDFLFDFSWTDSAVASTGTWTKGKPDGTSYFGNDCNPGSDVNGDFGDEAFVTGNNGGQAGDDDIDDGGVWLRSPVIDMDRYIDPIIDLEYWFFNDGGSGSPNDRIEFAILDSNNNRFLLRNISQSQSNWRSLSVRLKGSAPIQGPVRFEVYSTDDSPGHLVEAGLDHFRIREWTHPDCNLPFAGNVDTFFVGTGPCSVTLEPLLNDVFSHPDSITFRILTPPVVGTLIDSGNGVLTYYSNNPSSLVGDNFQYEICNNCPECDTVGVAISFGNVLPCNRNNAPFFSNNLTQPINYLQTTSNENTTDTFCLRPYDPDGDSVSHQLLDVWGSGTVSKISDSCYEYQPAFNFVGNDTFRIQICDLGLPSLCDTLMIRVWKLDTIQVGGIYRESLGLNLFPNPSQSAFTVEFEEVYSGQLELKDALGKMVTSESLNAVKIWHSSDLTELPYGMYVITLKAEDQIIQRTWLKR